MSAGTSDRLVPRWVHVWAILTVIVTACLLVLGGLVTTFRVGMADPVWPTTPWFLFSTSWTEPRPGFLIEHAHRLAGFSVGGLTAILVLGLWWTEPRAWSRWLGLLALIGLLANFGQFHRLLMEQVRAAEIVVPQTAVLGMLVSFLIVIVAALSGCFAGVRGSGLRAVGVLALVAVMIQGLLGGFRVRLNALFGTDLAAVHGVFAQVVFSMLVGLALVTARPSTRPDFADDARMRCRRFGLLLTGVVFLQLIWGAMIRHNPNTIVQRLHLITAFAVLAAAIWLIGIARESSTTWNRLRRSSVFLAILLTLQILFGVEAWMGKFVTGVLPELQKITTGMAIVRTAHVLIGTGILATSVSIVLLTRRPVRILTQETFTPVRDTGADIPALARSAPLGGAS